MTLANRAFTCALLIAAAALPARAASPTVDFVAAGPIVPLPAEAEDAQASIGRRALAAHIALLASPALAGRGLGTPGEAAAAEYVAAVLRAIGLVPLLPGVAQGALEDGYFQPVPLREIEASRGSVTVARRHDAATVVTAFVQGVDCRLVEVPPQTLTAPAVYVGTGIRESALDWDDYRDLDIRGKIVVMRSGTPTGAAWTAPELRRHYAPEDPDDRWTAKLKIAAALGAAAVVAIDTDAPPTPGTTQEVEPTFFLPGAGDGAPDVPPLIVVGPAFATACLGGAGIAGPPRELPGVSITIRAVGDVHELRSRNVLAVLPGRDPERRDEAVIVGAHLDHLGAPGGVVHPGADDNASGVAAVLEIARAMAALPHGPARTVVFALWTGEEEGELGSGAYVRHPVWPLDRTAVYINLDMIGHPWLESEIRALVRDAGLPDGEAFLTGLDPARFAEAGLPDGADHLATALRRAARATGLALHLDRTDGVNGGSDYREFARARVPFIRFFGNFFPAYHEPGDTPEALDPAQVQRIARLALATAWQLANP